VTREEEAVAIAQFLGGRGATRCPTVFVTPTAANLSPAEQAERLEQLQLKPGLTRRQILAAWSASMRPRSL
jgi:hypothetical protein